MHTIFLLALTPLALASTDLFRRSMLLPRQGSDAFQPGVSGYTTDCPNPCGATECLLPSRGDTCCVEGYGCPGGSFCLTQGYCCPDGDDPATCATQYGITLPNNFKAGQTVAAVLSSSAAAPAPVTPSSTLVAPTFSSTAPPSTPTPSTTAAVVSTSVAPPYPTGATNATIAPPSTATGTLAVGTSAVAFTGGAVRFAVDAGVAGFVLGAVGLLM